MAENKEELNVEAALAELESLIKSLESSETSLMDSLDIYKQGIELADQCKDKLEGVEKDLQVLNPKEESANDGNGFM